MQHAYKLRKDYQHIAFTTSMVDIKLKFTNNQALAYTIYKLHNQSL
jgi:hypothetical protein